MWWRRWRGLGGGLPQMILRNLRFNFGLKLVRNTGNLIKGPGVVAVACFGWWTASDVPKELIFQLWLKISEKYQKPD